MLSSGPVVCAAAAGAGWGGGREAWRDLGPQWGGKEGALQMKRGRREGEKMRTVHSEPRGTPDMAQVALGVKILLPPVTARGSAQAVTRWPRNGLPAPPPSPPTPEDHSRHGQDCSRGSPPITHSDPLPQARSHCRLAE